MHLFHRIIWILSYPKLYLFKYWFFRFQDIHVILTEHDETHWFQSHVFAQRADMKSKWAYCCWFVRCFLCSRMKVIDLFDENHRTKSLDECVTRTDEKSLIVIESLPWLLLRTSEGNLCRSLHQWSRKRNLMINEEVILDSFRIPCHHCRGTLGLCWRQFSAEKSHVYIEHCPTRPTSVVLRNHWSSHGTTSTYQCGHHQISALLSNALSSVCLTFHALVPEVLSRCTTECQSAARRKDQQPQIEANSVDRRIFQSMAPWQEWSRNWHEPF